MPPPSLKRVTCWCERTIGPVPVDDIRHGLTFSCGLWWCSSGSGLRIVVREGRSRAYLTRRAAA